MNSRNHYLQAKVIIPFFMQITLIIYVVSALQLSSPIVDGMLSESSFPVIVFLIATPAALKLLFDGVKEAKKEIAAGKDVVIKKKNIKPVLTVLIMAVFIALFELLGFSILAPLYVFFFMMVYDDKSQFIVKKIVFALLIAVVVYIMYAIAFDIRFPEIWR